MTKKRIVEADGYFVIRPHPELPVSEVEYGDRGEVVEIAKKGGKVYAREIRFPKSKWKRKDVEETAAAHGECPYCGDGVSEHAVPEAPVDWWRVGGAVVAATGALRVAAAVDALRGTRAMVSARNVVIATAIASLVWASSRRSARSSWRVPAAIYGITAVTPVAAALIPVPRARELPSARPPGEQGIAPFMVKAA